jgi:flagellar hook-basal body complex protein FliE
MSIRITNNAAEKILNQLKDIQSSAKQESDGLGKPAAGSKDFASYLKDSVMEVDQSQKTADKMATSLASGKTENIHETMLAATKAELQFNLMVQIRNKALEAYSEIMRMPV